MSPLGLLDRWLAPAPDAAKVAWVGQTVFAHRGLHGPGLPENSLEAAAAAIARGYGIECDIQRSSDGQAMVFHDFDLERLTHASGRVIDHGAAQLGAIQLSGGGGTIPTLRQLLDLIDGRVPLLIEIKSKRERSVAPLCLAVRRVLEGYSGPHAAMSFDPRVSRWFAVHSPRTVRGLVISENNDRSMPARLKRHLSLWHGRPHFLAYDVRDLPSRFAQAQRRRGMPVATWTVRTPELRERAAALADAPIAEGDGFGVNRVAPRELEGRDGRE